MKINNFYFYFFSFLNYGYIVCPSITNKLNEYKIQERNH